MRINFLVIAFLLISQTAYAELSPEKINQIVDAIGKIENSKKYPYGIKSIPTNGNKEYARKICYNTVRNNYRRWLKSDRKKTYLKFLADRYCPIGASDDLKTNLNKNWYPNIVRMVGEM